MRSSSTTDQAVSHPASSMTARPACRMPVLPNSNIESRTKALRLDYPPLRPHTALERLGAGFSLERLSTDDCISKP